MTTYWPVSWSGGWLCLDPKERLTDTGAWLCCEHVFDLVFSLHHAKGDVGRRKTKSNGVGICPWIVVGTLLK